MSKYTWKTPEELIAELELRDKEAQNLKDKVREELKTEMAEQEKKTAAEKARTEATEKLQGKSDEYKNKILERMEKNWLSYEDAVRLEGTGESKGEGWEDEGRQGSQTGFRKLKSAEFSNLDGKSKVDYVNKYKETFKTETVDFEE